MVFSRSTEPQLVRVGTDAGPAALLCVRAERIRSISVTSETSRFRRGSLLSFVWSAGSSVGLFASQPVASVSTGFILGPRGSGPLRRASKGSHFARVGPDGEHLSSGMAHVGTDVNCKPLKENGLPIRPISRSRRLQPAHYARVHDAQPEGCDYRGSAPTIDFDPGRRAGLIAANQHTTKVQTGGQNYGSE